MSKPLLRYINRIINVTHRPGGAHRLHARLQSTSEITGRVLEAAVFIASLVCITALVVYTGFDNNHLDRRSVFHVITSMQGVFIVAAVINITFRHQNWVHDNMALKKCADIVLLLSLLPLFFRAESSACRLLDVLRSHTFLFAVLGLYSTAEVCYGTMQLLGKRTNPSLILSCSFLFFILAGSLVLMLPRSTLQPIRYIDALFMASSAVSMTGLCTIDVSHVLSPMGWLVIAILMQIGALGVLTFTSFFALFFSGRGSVYNQLLVRDFIYSKSMAQLMPVLLYILGFTLCVETVGAVAVYSTLPPDFLDDAGQRMAFSAFHSISAFCNAGFCPLPQGLADPVLLYHTRSFYVVTTVLIIAGGIGFPNLVNFKDVVNQWFRSLKARLLKRPYSRPAHVYDLNNKLVLMWTGILFAGGAIMFYILEYNNTFEGLDNADRVVQALFSSATVRTAGFATAQPQQWLGATLWGAMMLMWIGCASQSMGGGIKINTFAAVMLNLRSIVYGQKGVTAFGRSVPLTSIRCANATVCFSVFAIFTYAFVLMLLQPDMPAGALAFEAFSAVTTVGMSTGITPELSDLSKVAVASAMFLGRVGIISVLSGLVSNRTDHSAMLPGDDIIIN